MTTIPQPEVVCQICRQHKAPEELIPAGLVREALAEMIRKTHPDWSSESFICLADLQQFRIEYVEDVIEREKGELSNLEMKVLESIAEHTLLSENLNVQFDQKRTFGARIAEVLAEFFGSWKFLTTFAVVLVAWLAINGAELLGHRFDPFPFDILKLILATSAAVQAPIILMSQNRQKAKDRLRAENEYLVSMKAELEIRHVNAKLDILLSRWWPRLHEIERLQMDAHRKPP